MTLPYGQLDIHKFQNQIEIEQDTIYALSVFVLSV